MLRQSPLHDEHVALGARLVPFAGWEMPVSYPQGTLAEHRSCREDAAAFDVSHLGTVEVGGPDAFDLLQSAFTNDLGKVSPGRAQYTHLLDDDGSVLDDIIVWWVAADRFHVMPNASNTDRVRSAVGGEDVTATRAVIAVQGPAARDRLRSVFPAAADVGRFRVATAQWKDSSCVVAGTGYTGEDGVEISVPGADAASLWQAILDAGVTAAGLGARDTLRLEAGLPLHGHELGPGITPLEAGLGWVVAWGKDDFRGKAALEAQRERGVDRRIRGIAVDGRQPPRDGYAVSLAGKPVGTVTSGNFSPTLGYGIGLALLAASVGEGAEVELDARGRSMPARVVSLPFVKKDG